MTQDPRSQENKTSTAVTADALLQRNMRRKKEKRNLRRVKSEAKGICCLPVLQPDWTY